VFDTVVEVVKDACVCLPEWNYIHQLQCKCWNSLITVQCSTPTHPHTHTHT